jgi:predicted RNase H-like nuclease (RuvC/YqgF family)
MYDNIFDNLATNLHEAAIKKGFWPEEDDVDDIFIAKQCMMIVSEVTEVMEAIRKDKGEEEITKEFELGSAAKDARLHQFEEQLETLKQENLELTSKHSVLTEELLRKSELIENRDEIINQANKAFEAEKKQVLELTTKLEDAETKINNSVNANLALQDLMAEAHPLPTSPYPIIKTLIIKFFKFFLSV